MSFGLRSYFPGAALLRPVIALNVWTLGMEVWMYATRLPALGQYNVNFGPDSPKSDLETKLPPSVRWKADNYNHLMEQPTQFYAVAIALSLLAPTDSLNTRLAWTYVGLRVTHSLVQALTNTILTRFRIFALSSLVLTGMTARAVMLVI